MDLASDVIATFIKEDRKRVESGEISSQTFLIISNQSKFYLMQIESQYIGNPLTNYSHEERQNQKIEHTQEKKSKECLKLQAILLTKS